MLFNNNLFLLNPLFISLANFGIFTHFQRIQKKTSIQKILRAYLIQGTHINAVVSSAVALAVDVALGFGYCRQVPLQDRQTVGAAST